MKTTVCLLFSVLAAYAGASTLLSESFETLATGSVGGQNNWVLESGTGDVQTSQTFSGTQALEVQNGSVSHSLTNSQNAIWTRFQAFITSAPDTNPTVTSGNTSVAFFVNTNLTLTVYSNTTPVEINAPVATNVWTRFDVYCDYETMTWNLSMNGTTVAAALPLFSDNQEIEEVLIANNSSDSVFVDDLEIANTEIAAQAPDADRDGIPDWWELKYSSSISGLSAVAMSGNPGWTYLQTYTAGISPTSSEPFQATQTGPFGLVWTGKPGRVYDIFWASNLLSGFTPIATGLSASQTAFVDTSSNTNLPTGYYKLQVRVDD
ncbi:hypothetical protein [Tichowtungia aerotolerans]|uniref:Uncharacterized protein n=1 Tax=Tichowtungia aerotolerans TaxID=2697043 RepID=A0A6P1M594_9BACT|nr:hypothetical protein [Tichowtungia aerotolerans]QHI69222.1 hypothetical protein GT409_07070 [Tichowtungia aerotolerans]